MRDFAGLTVLITGAASGIGAEMSRLFESEGATVFAADVTSGATGFGVPLVADVTNASDVEAMINTVVEQTGRLDVLCNNAGVVSTTDPVSCSVDEWDRVFAVNAKGVFLGIKFALPVMLRQNAGAIVNTASVAGLVGLRSRTAYCASKGAVIALTRQVAVEYATRGIRCNCICPGTVASPWVDRLTESSIDPQSARQALVSRQPLGRLGEPAEVARAALYLASEKTGGFITGTALVIDGGLIAA